VVVPAFALNRLDDESGDVVAIARARLPDLRHERFSASATRTVLASFMGNTHLGLSILGQSNFGKYIVFRGSAVLVMLSVYPVRPWECLTEVDDPAAEFAGIPLAMFFRTFQSNDALSVFSTPSARRPRRRRAVDTGAERAAGTSPRTPRTRRYTRRCWRDSRSPLA